MSYRAATVRLRASGQNFPNPFKHPTRAAKTQGVAIEWKNGPENLSRHATLGVAPGRRKDVSKGTKRPAGESIRPPGRRRAGWRLRCNRRFDGQCPAGGGTKPRRTRRIAGQGGDFLRPRPGNGVDGTRRRQGEFRRPGDSADYRRNLS